MQKKKCCPWCGGVEVRRKLCLRRKRGWLWSPQPAEAKLHFYSFMSPANHVPQITDGLHSCDSQISCINILYCFTQINNLELCSIWPFRLRWLIDQKLITSSLRMETARMRRTVFTLFIVFFESITNKQYCVFLLFKLDEDELAGGAHLLQIQSSFRGTTVTYSMFAQLFLYSHVWGSK